MLPVEHNDPINAKILAISEDKIEGFVREPFEEIAGRSGVAVETVMERIAAMLQAGTVRRVRQTLLATLPPLRRTIDRAQMVAELSALLDAEE